MLASTARSLLINIKPKVSLNSKLLFHLSGLQPNETKAPSESEQTAAEAPQAAGPSASELQEKLSKCENQLNDFKDRYMRALAETENTRIRLSKQIDDAKIYGIQGFCKDLLEVADILNLAIVNTDPKKNTESEQPANSEQLESMYNGLVMTEKCMLKIFSKHGLSQIIPSDGDKFNPNLHEAIFRVPLPGKTSGIQKCSLQIK